MRFIKCIFAKIYQEAIVDFEEAISRHGNSHVMDHSYQFYIALSLLKLNEFEKAEAILKQEINKMIQQFREGDELIVWRLNRLGRSLKHIIDLVLSLNEQGIIIKGLTDGVDTSTINGRLFLNLMASLAEYERELIRERTNAGLQSARARGPKGGRPKEYTKETVSKLLIMRSVYKDHTKKPDEIYTPLGLTRATLYRYAKILDKHTNEEIKKWKLKNLKT